MRWFSAGVIVLLTANSLAQIWRAERYARLNAQALATLEEVSAALDKAQTELAVCQALGPSNTPPAGDADLADLAPPSVWLDADVADTAVLVTCEEEFKPGELLALVRPENAKAPRTWDQDGIDVYMRAQLVECPCKRYPKPTPTPAPDLAMPPVELRSLEVGP